MARVVFHDGFLKSNPGTTDFGVSMTRQSEADQADVNKILTRFDKTGMLPVDQREALFIDVSEIGDYRSAVEQVDRVERYFMTLDASVRAKFNNDPAEFLDFAVNPANVSEMVDLGVWTKAERVKPPVEPAVKPEPVKPAVEPAVRPA